MVRGPMHHRHAKWIDRLIMVVADELEIAIEDLGETTWQREQVARGIEADLSYFFEPAKIETVRRGGAARVEQGRGLPRSRPCGRGRHLPAAGGPGGYLRDAEGAGGLALRRPDPHDLEAEGRRKVRAGGVQRVAGNPGRSGGEVADPGRSARSESVDHAAGDVGPRRYDIMNPPFDLSAWQAAIRRRAFLKNSVYGLGGIALAGLLDPSLFSTEGRAADTAKHRGALAGILNPPPRAVKARRVIHLCMAGRTITIRDFRLEARLKKLNGQPFPAVVHQGTAACAIAKHGLKAQGPFVWLPQARADRGRKYPTRSRILLGSPIGSASSGSMTTEQINHDPPCVHEQGLDHQGAAEHGLLASVRAGGRDRDLPGFVVFASAGASWAAACVGSASGRRDSCRASSRHPVPIAGRCRASHRQSAWHRSESCSGFESR